MSALIVTHHGPTSTLQTKINWVEFRACEEMLASRRTRSLVSSMLVWNVAAVMTKLTNRLLRRT